MNYSVLKFGIINDTDAARQVARVLFGEDGITSDWLPYLVRGSLDTKEAYPLPVNTHVACLMDCHCEDGVILGAIYSDVDTPDGGGVGVYRWHFEDGAEAEYTVGTNTFRFKTGDTEVILTPAGVTVQRAGETLKSLLSDLIDAILAETHTSSSGPTGPPINAAQYTAIKNRLVNLFEN